MTRVLIVEDEESFAEPLEFLLRKERISFQLNPSLKILISSLALYHPLFSLRKVR